MVPFPRTTLAAGPSNEVVQSVASFNETEARNFLHYFLFENDDPLRPTRELSYGERARLQLGMLFRLTEISLQLVV